MYASRTKGKPKAEGACKVARKAGRTGTLTLLLRPLALVSRLRVLRGAALAEASLSLL